MFCTLSLQRCSRSSWAVEVDILPPAVPAVPYSGLLWLAGAGTALTIHKLCQADVGDASSVIANDVHMWVEDGGMDGLAVLGEDWQGDGGFRIVSYLKLHKNINGRCSHILTVVKVKSMEVHSLHQITQPLWFKRGQARVTDLPVNRQEKVRTPTTLSCLRLFIMFMKCTHNTSCVKTNSAIIIFQLCPPPFKYTWQQQHLETHDFLQENNTKVTIKTENMLKIYVMT